MTAAATFAALVGFAANSLLCRMALGSGAIDPWSFTAIRLGSGALALALLCRVASGSFPVRRGGSWASSIALLAYAVAFSLAYVRVSTGVGALVLFGSVQATMFGWSVAAGAKPTAAEWWGLLIALGGLALFALPGAKAPDPWGLGLMALAGAAWGVYTLRGRRASAPLAATAENFLRSAPFAAMGLLATLPEAHATARGVELALASGILASGLGYTLWYWALPRLAATRAAVVQIPVPVLAAAAGVIFLGEEPSLRLAAAGAMILGGVAIAILVRRK